MSTAEVTVACHEGERTLELHISPQTTGEDLVRMVMSSLESNAAKGSFAYVGKFVLEMPSGAVVDRQIRISSLEEDHYRLRPFKRKPSYAPRIIYSEDADVEKIGATFEFSSYFECNRAKTRMQKGVAHDWLALILCSCTRPGRDNCEMLAWLGSLWAYTSPPKALESIEHMWEDAHLFGMKPEEKQDRLFNFIETIVMSPYYSDIDEEFKKLVKGRIFDWLGRGDKQMMLAARVPKKLPVLTFDSAMPVVELLPRSSGVQRNLNLYSIVFAPLQVLADQLVLMECRLHRQVTLDQLWNIKWQKFPDQCKQLTALSLRFTKVVNWVILTLLFSRSLKDFVLAYKRFAKLVTRLMDMRAYNVAAQIGFGLTSSNITRAKCLTHKIPVKVATAVNKTMKYFLGLKNFAAYRKLDHSHPCLPFLAVHQHDLVYVHEKRVSEVKLNVRVLDADSIRAESDIVLGTKLHEHSTADYSGLVKECPTIEEQFEQLPSVDEDELWDLSTTIAPVGTQSFRPLSEDDVARVIVRVSNEGRYDIVSRVQEDSWTNSNRADSPMPELDHTERLEALSLQCRTDDTSTITANLSPRNLSPRTPEDESDVFGDDVLKRAPSSTLPVFSTMPPAGSSRVYARKKKGVRTASDPEPVSSLVTPEPSEERAATARGHRRRGSLHSSPEMPSGEIDAHTLMRLRSTQTTEERLRVAESRLAYLERFDVEALVARVLALEHRVQQLEGAHGGAK